MKIVVFCIGIILLAVSSLIRGKLCDDMEVSVKIAAFVAITGVVLLTACSFVMQ